MSLFFHSTVKEAGSYHQQLVEASGDRQSVATLFKSFSLYQVAVVYMCARLFGNMIQVLVPFYVQKIMNIGVSSIAIIPFVMYISSFLTSLYVGPLNKKVDRQVCIPKYVLVLVNELNIIDFIKMMIISDFFSMKATGSSVIMNIIYW